MRIISDFKDYYDIALGFGADPNLLYLRKTESFEYEVRSNVGKHQLPHGLDDALRQPLKILRTLPRYLCLRDGYRAHPLEVPLTTKVIGFCGLLHAAIDIGGSIFRSMDQVLDSLSDDFLRQWKTNRRTLERILTAKDTYWTWERRAASNWAIPLTSQFWNEATTHLAEKRFDDAFIESGVPVFLLEYITTNKHGEVDRIRCTLNPCLRDEGFQKIKPPAETFQEIAMYLGNQLARQADPVSKFPDEILRDEKGFDEWSFRRHKAEDKKHRKQNKGN